MRRIKTYIGAWAIVLSCVMAGALVTAGSANAASRGFKLRNESRQKLRLLGVNRVARFVCHGIPVKVCDDEFFDMEFEGRPGNGRC